MSEFKPITLNTQEECDEFVKDRIDRAKKQVAEQYKDYEDLKANNTKLTADLGKANDDLKTAQDTIKENTTKIEGLQAQVHKYEIDSVKTKVAQEFKLPSGLESRLNGEDEEAIREDAKALAESLKITEPTPPMFENNDGGTEDNTLREGMRNMLKNAKGE